MDIKKYLADIAALVDDALDHYLPDEERMPKNLHRAMRYSVFAGGKRIRPVLMMAACDAVGGRRDNVIAAACAMEMIHTYSLIHDDLPAMDDDDFRRGQPTNHKVFGEANAILAGDALLTEAFVVLSEAESGILIDPEIRRKVIRVIARAAGCAGMVGGQVVDMESEGKDIDMPTLEYIHIHKTGALIKASIEVGALLGGASDDAFVKLSRYGELAGLAFQIADDILDVTAEQGELGKDVGSDEARGKATYVSLLGLRQSRERADELREMAMSTLDDFGEEAEPLRQTMKFIIERTS
ncbi:MAG: polyprenyl synthetase [Desulfuromonas sp.]|nr:MAG: polyprenyl synthetase [Desulfuromonas sp.]